MGCLPPPAILLGKNLKKGELEVAEVSDVSQVSEVEEQDPCRLWRACVLCDPP